MERKNVMKKTIKHILADLDRVSAVVRMVEQELNDLGHHTQPSSKLAGMKEKLGEIHARLDGMREFVLHCQSQAVEEPLDQEVDVWL